MSVDVTFFEDTPFFVSSIESESISQVLPIPFLVPVIPPTSVIDQSTTSSSTETPSPPPRPPPPLQIYQCRPRLPLADPQSTKSPSDSSPALTFSSTSDPPTLLDDLPITLRKGTRSTRNPHPIYNFLSHHRFSPTHYTFISSLFYVTIPKSLREALCNIPEFSSSIYINIY